MSFSWKRSYVSLKTSPIRIAWENVICSFVSISCHKVWYFRVQFPGAFPWD